MSEALGNFETYCNYVKQYASNMDDYPFVIDLKRQCYYISESVETRFAMEHKGTFETVRSNYGFVLPEDFNPMREDLHNAIFGTQQEISIRCRWVDRNGGIVWVHFKGTILRDETGAPDLMVGCINEIGERQKADNITGLRQTKDIVDELNQGGYPRGFFMRLGLDGFKNVVERLGMDYGDRVLHNVAECIKQCLMPEQRLYRAISDEFLIIDFNDGSKNDALRLYRKIRMAIDYYIESNGYQSVFTISGGAIGTIEIENQTYNEVMKMSRFCLNMAKNRGRNQVYFFNPDEYVEFLHRRDVNRALRQAVANEFEGFELYYQPITYSKDGRIYAAEALCRFFMKGKMISPVEFIPMLEESGLIIPVGRWIMDQAMAMVKLCRQYNPEFRLSVNLSYIQVTKTGLTDELIGYLKKHQVDSSALMVELTESGYLENSASIERVWNRLRDNGVRIAVDDFGTGYSNMRYLDRLRPNVIKIDRGFTNDALSREYAFRLLANIVQMAHSMNLLVCIEGIETEEELKAIQTISPDFIQGFYFGKPCSKETFLEKYMKA